MIHYLLFLSLCLCHIIALHSIKCTSEHHQEETEKWDSIGHMMLIAALEEAFSIEFEPEEMLELDSYGKGIELLRKKGIAL